MCVVTLFVYIHFRHVCLRVMCQLLPTLSQRFYCCRCPDKYLGSRWYAVFMFLSGLHMTSPRWKVCLSCFHQYRPAVHHTPSQSSAHLPLFKVLKGTLFSRLFCSLSRLSSRCLLFLCSTRQKINTQPFQLGMTVHTCGCSCVHECLCARRETNMKQMFG